MAARPIDLFGGIDYGKWKLSPVLSIPFNTLVPPATNIPGVAVPQALAQLWGIASGTAFPAAPATGALFYRTDLGRLYIYNGAIWVLVPGIPITETGILRVIVSVNPGALFSLVITRGFPAAPVTIVQFYNAAVLPPALVANGLYLFDCPVLFGDIVNFQFAAPTSISVLDAYMILMQGP